MIRKLVDIGPYRHRRLQSFRKKLKLAKIQPPSIPVLVQKSLDFGMKKAMTKLRKGA